MGSSAFAITAYGYATTDAGMRKAYASLCEEARYMEGADPYNGTIATTSGVTRGGSELLVEGTPEYDKVVQRAWDRTRKWEECRAFPLREVAAPEIEHRGTVTVTRSINVSAMEDTYSGPALRQAEATRIARAVLRKHAKGQGTATYAPDTMRGKLPTDNPVCTRSTVKVSAPGTVVESGSGRIETRYAVIDRAEVFRPREPEWDTGYTTAARAYAAARKLAQDAARAGRSARIEVVPVVRHVDGETPKITVQPWSVSSAKTKTVTAQLTLDVGELIAPATPTGRTGWLFAGWAAE